MNKYQKRKSRVIRNIMRLDPWGRMTYKEAKRKFDPKILRIVDEPRSEFWSMYPQIIVPPGNTAREDLFHGGFTSPPLISILPHDSRSPEDVFDKLIEEESL